MPFVNKIEIMGNLARDPELRHMPNGTPTTKITVAVAEKWADKTTGETKEHVEWFPVQLYNRQAEVVCSHMKKGDCILVYGKQRTRPYTDGKGTERTVTEIIAAEMQIIRTARPANPPADDLSGGIYGMM